MSVLNKQPTLPPTQSVTDPDGLLSLPILPSTLQTRDEPLPLDQISISGTPPAETEIFPDIVRTYSKLIGDAKGKPVFVQVTPDGALMTSPVGSNAPLIFSELMQVALGGQQFAGSSLAGKPTKIYSIQASLTGTYDVETELSLELYIAESIIAQLTPLITLTGRSVANGADFIINLSESFTFNPPLSRPAAIPPFNPTSHLYAKNLLWPASAPFDLSYVLVYSL